jgi:hypothetical protein
MALPGPTGCPTARQQPHRDPVVVRVQRLPAPLVPETFSVPNRYTKHMMVVADLENGNADAIEDAIIGAWELQSGN